MLRLEYPPKTVWSVDLFGLWYHCPQKPRLLLRDGEDILRVYRHFDARYSLRTDLAHGFLSSIPNPNPVAQSLEPWIVLLIISLILVGAHFSMRTDYIVHSTEKYIQFIRAKEQPRKKTLFPPSATEALSNYERNEDFVLVRCFTNESCHLLEL